MHLSLSSWHGGDRCGDGGTHSLSLSPQFTPLLSVTRTSSVRWKPGPDWQSDEKCVSLGPKGPGRPWKETPERLQLQGSTFCMSPSILSSWQCRQTWIESDPGNRMNRDQSGRCWSGLRDVILRYCNTDFLKITVLSFRCKLTQFITVMTTSALGAPVTTL
jgi:hypothetical protein